MTIHRFNFSENLNKEIQRFSNLHMYDTNEDFNDRFNEWIEQPSMNKLIQQENEYLERYNYTNDIKSKIYRSIKYYYIKKFSSNKNNETKQRIKINKISNIMIENIKEDLTKHFNTNPSFKPSETYKLFTTDTDPIIKKCYKNQYYQIKNKMYNVNV